MNNVWRLGKIMTDIVLQENNEKHVGAKKDGKNEKKVRFGDNSSCIDWNSGSLFI